MQYRNINRSCQVVRDGKTARRSNTAQAEPTKGRPNGDGSSDHLFEMLYIQTDGKGIHGAKGLKEDARVFKHGQGCQWTNVAEAKGRGAIGNQSDGIATNRIVKGGERLLRDGKTRSRYARCVEQAQHRAILERDLTCDSDHTAKAFAILQCLLRPQAKRRGRTRRQDICLRMKDRLLAISYRVHSRSPCYTLRYTICLLCSTRGSAF